MAAPRKRRTWTRASHRWLGMALLLPLTIVCVTGLILNHTVDLDLSKRHVTSDWVQARYGMSLEGDPVAFGLDGKAYAATWDGKIFHRKSIVSDEAPLIGAVPLRDGIAVVTTTSVHYFGLDGELIESLDSVSLPAVPMARSGVDTDLNLVIETSSGTFTADTDLLNFSPSAASLKTRWSTIVTPSEADLKAWKTTFSGDGIPLDRLILDLHSGRFFGTIGKWIYDLVVIGVLILSVTGFVLYIRTRRRAR